MILEDGTEVLTAGEWRKKRRFIREDAKGIKVEGKKSIRYPKSETIVDRVVYPYEWREKYGKELFTKKQWEKKGKYLKKDARAIFLYPSYGHVGGLGHIGYFSEDDVE